MLIAIWTAENAAHIEEHGIEPSEVDDVLANYEERTVSRTSGRPIVFGETSTGRRIAVVFEFVDDDKLYVYPITAFEVI